MSVRYRIQNSQRISRQAAHVILDSKTKDNKVVRTPQGQITLSVGIGERAQMTRRTLIRAARKIIAIAKANKTTSITLELNDFDFPNLALSPRDLAELIATNFEMANFEFVKYKTPPKEGFTFVKTATLVIQRPVSARDVQEGIRRGTLIGSGVNACRALANTPGGEMTPRLLARAARDATHGTKVRVTVFGKRDMQKRKMGAILGVAQGSTEEPQFIILEYRGGKRNEAPIVLVGKGVTFDTGGLNLKPSDAILEMHMDMSGGAAVIHAITLAARLNLKKNVIALVPAVENMPSGSSYRPGDILRSLSGKTIEVMNTDAEGRIILADALTYAKRYKPELVVDVATLTGAAMAAVGQRAVALFTKSQSLQERFEELGEASGDYVWPLPLWDEYEEDIQGTFGDIINTSKTRYGGAIAGAMFLYQFAKEYPWVHLDIAPRMTAIDGDYLAKGAAGSPVRLLVKLLEEGVKKRDAD